MIVELFVWKNKYKRMISTTTDKSRDNSNISPFFWLNFSDDMVYCAGEWAECFVLFFISCDKHKLHRLFIIAYKLHWVCIIERGRSYIDLFQTFVYIYMSIFKEIIITNKIFFYSFNFDERWFNSVTDIQIFKMKWLHIILCEKCQLKYLMN